MGQVSAVGKIHAENGVAWLDESKIGGHVGLRAGMGLHIHVFAAKELLGTLDGKVLCHVHKFAAAVVAMARIAFCVLVGQGTALGLAHGRRHKVLGGNELELCQLPLALQGNDTGKFRIFKEDFVHWRLLGLSPALGRAVWQTKGFFGPWPAAEKKTRSPCLCAKAANISGKSCALQD